MGEGPFSWLIFIHLAPLMKQIKRSRGRLLWCVDLLTAYDRWLYTLLLCKHSQTDIGKPSAPKFRCTNTEYMRPRVSKELFISESEKLPLRRTVVAHNSRYPFRYSGFLKGHGYEFIFKKERNLLDRKGIITFIFVLQIYYVNILSITLKFS